MIETHQVTAVILAGGKGRRYAGTDKGLMTFNGQPLIKHILTAIIPQVENILINANRNLETYEKFGFPVIQDNLEDFQGPLAGFAVALQNARSDYIVTLPCDGPFIPHDYVKRLVTALQTENSEIAVAHDGTRLQPVHALLPVSLLDSLMRFLQSGDRKIDRWYASHRMALADFSDQQETFKNINTQQEHENLQTELKQHS
jgi:molybdenum cofactor guanylyltransferase